MIRYANKEFGAKAYELRYHSLQYLYINFLLCTIKMPLIAHVYLIDQRRLKHDNNYKHKFIYTQTL